MRSTITTSERVAAATGATALAVAAAWNALITAAITAPPQPGGGNEALFAWWRPIEWQTAGVHVLAALGFLALAVLGGLRSIRPRDDDAGIGRVGGLTLVAGGLFGALAHLVQVGAQQAVITASATAVDPGTLGAIGYALDRVVAAIQLGGYGALAVAFVALAADAPRDRAPFRVLSVAIGVAAAVIAVSTQLDPLGVGDGVTLLVAIVLLPSWAWAGTFRGLTPRGQLAPVHGVQPR
jgi:hypothetical protein